MTYVKSKPFSPPRSVKRIVVICCALFVSFAIMLQIGSHAVHADDVGDGRTIFLQKCIGCHAFTCNKDGPKLGGLFGRRVASVEDYDGYTDGLKNSTIVWQAETLDNFFSDPAALFPESTMAATGKVEDPEMRRKLIAFLKTEDPAVNLCAQ